MVDLNGKLRLHPAFAHRVEQVGSERNPVLVIDNFLADADVLVDFAAAHCSFAAAGAYYPGIRAPTPPIYSFAVRAFLAEIIRQAFTLPTAEVAREKCDFSIVTTPPERLSPIQRVPHADNTDPKHFAVLHYLCALEQGGTSFYRHRQTGFESLNAERLPAYNKAMESALGAYAAHTGYVNGDDATFERVASFDAAFNRVLVYSGMVLHSADIAPEFRFDPNPRTGRLTANVFYYFR